MTYRLIIRPETEQDLIDAFEWYEDEEIGVGTEFLHAFEDALQHISANPFAYQITIGSTRRRILERFPYSIFFTVVGESIIVTACVHHRRHPHVWRSRPRN